MKSRQFVGMRIDDFVTNRVVHTLRRRGWREVIVPFTGYGTEDHVRVLGRLILRPAKPKTTLGLYAETLLHQRGWRNFVSTPVPRRPVAVKVKTIMHQILRHRKHVFRKCLKEIINNLRRQFYRPFHP